ncbi:DUF4175 family protein [Paracoccaceae bacterium GXU_MW_L88]
MAWLTRTPSETDPLARNITRSRNAIRRERILRALWPGGSLALAGIGLSWFAVPYSGWLALAGASVAAIMVARAPKVTDAEAIARLDEGDPAHPLASLQDHAVTGDPELWERSQADMANRAAALKLRKANPDLSKRDPWGLRLAALIVVVAGTMFGVAPRFAPERDGTLTIWAEPPSYTGRGAQPLDFSEPARLPIGSNIYLQAQDMGRIWLNATLGEEQSFTPPAPPERAEITLNASGHVSLRRPWGARDIWRVTAIADLPPEVDITEIESDQMGRMRLALELRDDYGVTAQSLHIEMPPPSVELGPAGFDAPDPITLGGPFWEGDFAKHPLAGRQVILFASAEDALGQTGESSLRRVTLPRRHFQNTHAARLVAIRSDLIWNPARNSALSAVRLRNYLGTVTDLPAGPYLGAQRSLRLLYRAEPIEAAELLWQVAIALEEEGLDRIRQLVEALRQALAEGAPQEEISALMDQLRAELARRAAEAPQAPANMQNGTDLAQQLDQIEALSEAGAQDAAQELLDQLAQMLNQPMMQNPQAGGLDEMIRQQQQLNDQTFSADPSALPQMQSMQEALAEMMQALAESGPGDAPGELGEAQSQMEAAAQAMAQGDQPGALAAQAGALQAMSQLRQQMMGQQPGQQSPGMMQGRDPLGRPSQGFRQENLEVPGDMPDGNARALRETIRERLQDPALAPRMEDYLRSLLRSFGG